MAYLKIKSDELFIKQSLRVVGESTYWRLYREAADAYVVRKHHRPVPNEQTRAKIW